MKIYRLVATWAICAASILAGGSVLADTCQQLEAVINKSRSFQDVQKQGQALKISASDLRRCQGKLAGNQKLQQFVTREKLRLSRNSGSRQTRVQRQVKAPEQLTINRRAVQLRTEAKNKLTSLQRSTSRTAINRTAIRTAPIKRPGGTDGQTGQPKITAVTPGTLVPGTDVLIEGENLGSNAGTVTLKLQGKSFTAVINSWNDTWVNAYLEDSIGGVLPSDNAVLSVQVPQSSAINRNIPFIPLYVQKSISTEYDSPGSLIFPGSGSTTIFSGKTLNTGWQVTDYSISAEPTFGECELGTPSLSVGGDRVESKLNWSYDWWEGFAWCYVDVYAEGPQGVGSGL